MRYFLVLKPPTAESPYPTCQHLAENENGLPESSSIRTGLNKPIFFLLTNWQPVLKCIRSGEIAIWAKRLRIHQPELFGPLIQLSFRVELPWVTKVIQIHLITRMAAMNQVLTENLAVWKAWWVGCIYKKHPIMKHFGAPQCYIYIYMKIWWYIYIYVNINDWKAPCESFIHLNPKKLLTATHGRQNPSWFLGLLTCFGCRRQEFLPSSGITEVGPFRTKNNSELCEFYLPSPKFRRKFSVPSTWCCESSDAFVANRPSTEPSILRCGWHLPPVSDELRRRGS